MSARVIMVASGKGGTGKSTVSVLTGAALAARGRRVLLVELDSALRSVDYIAGVYGKTVYDVEDVLCGRCDAGKALVESPLYPGLFVISAPYSGGQVAAGALQSFLQQAGAPPSRPRALRPAWRLFASRQTLWPSAMGALCATRCWRAAVSRCGL